MLATKLPIEKSDTNNNIKGLLTGWGLTAKPCDVCHTASALLYCRVDATFLCGACDFKVHAPASHHHQQSQSLMMMMARHERVWMCEVCEQAPAAVTCKADAAVLCVSCDHDIHSANPLARRHERVPVVPFFESVVDSTDRSNAATDVNSAFLAKDDGDDPEAWLIPNPNSSFLYNESCLLDCGGKNLGKISQPQQMINQQQSYDSLSFAISDSVVPTQSQGNLNFPNKSNHLFDSSGEVDFTQPAKHNNMKNKFNNNDNIRQQIFSSFDFSANQHSVSSSEIGVVPEGNTNSPSEVSQTFGNSATGSGVTAAARGDPVTALDREARVLRYREKRKNRKFEKTIRYASRKAYAESRPRIKGRFAKRSGKNETSDLNRILGSDFGSTPGSNFLLEQDYGVVPTF